MILLWNPKLNLEAPLSQRWATRSTISKLQMIKNQIRVMFLVIITMMSPFQKEKSMSLLLLNSKRKHGSNPWPITNEPPCKMNLVKALPKILTKRGRARHLAGSILKTSRNNNTLSKRHKKPQEMSIRVRPLLFYPTRKESPAQVSSWIASTWREAVTFMT